MTAPMIDNFHDAHAFLSNFYPSRVQFEGTNYPSVEHAYQAAKSLNLDLRKKIRSATSPGRAKKAGRSIPLRDDWEDVKIDVMRQIVLDKFMRSRKLAKDLLATGEADLVEGNTWGDTFWGVCRGKGENRLGQILMEVRAYLRGEKTLFWHGTLVEADEIRTFARVPRVRTARKPIPHVAIDTETYLIIPGLLAPKVVCATYCTDKGDSGILNRRDAVAYTHDLLDRGVALIGHNIAYDLACLAAVDDTLVPKIMKAYDEDRIHDTYVREKLLLLAVGQLADEGETGAKRQIKFSLDAIVKRRFNRDISADKKGDDVWRLRYSELDGVPLNQWPQKATAYAIGDACWTMAVFEAQESEARGGVIDAHHQTRAAFWLHLMGVWGVRTDPERVNRLNDEVRGQFENINATMKKWGIIRPQMKKGKEVWTKDMKVVKGLITQSYGGDHKVPKTKTGNVSTSRATLLQTPHPHQEGCVFNAEDGEWRCTPECLVGALHALGLRSGVEKLLTTFIPALLMGTQVPINPRWNELVATGRTSCMNPNMQQPPRKGGVRECFVPRPGFMYVAADYSFIELCSLAQVCLDLYGQSALADAINAGLDPHLDMAALLMGITYPEALRRMAAKDPEVKEFRQLSKALNFGLPGGLGAEKFVDYALAGYGVTIDVGYARQLKPLWQQKWPEMVRFHADLGNRTRFGRSFTLEQLRSGRLRGDCGFCDGCNSYFQGLAADGAKRAGWLIAKECYLKDPYRDGQGPSVLFGSRLVLFLHDEFVLEVPVANASAAGDRLSALMNLGMEVVIPDVAVKTEPVLMERWFKGADTVRDDNGNLIPWRPAA